VVGLFVSGVILLTISTILYTGELLSLTSIMALAFVGAAISDHLGYYLGRIFGTSFHSTSFAVKRADQLNKAERFIAKYGAAAIIVGRLMTAVRSLVPALVGVSGIDRIKFTLIDLLACAIWSAGLGLLVIGIESFTS